MEKIAQISLAEAVGASNFDRISIICWDPCHDINFWRGVYKMSEAEPLNTCTLRAKTLLIFDYVYIFQSADEFCLYRILDSY